MGNLKTGHLVEAALWLALAGLLYAYSFRFDKAIEIYRFGASAWPRAVLLLIAVAAVGQLLYHWKVDRRGGDGDGDGDGDGGDGETTARARDMLAAASDDGAETAARESHHTGADGMAGIKWYASTFGILALPFLYLLLPGWLTADESGALHTVKLTTAAVVVALYVAGARANRVGAMLALPVLFAAFMQDFGFYALAPFFILAVMFLLGERRGGPMALVAAVILGVLLLLFVSVLYVGLPTGNVSPFYEIGTGLVTILQ
ncbi:MAG: hypothetical protein OXU98_10445 [Gammaproteobacteria bacterium]|nr:hypothetical protein [Gammaproteobacteria bacterium]